MAEKTIVVADKPTLDSVLTNTQTLLEDSESLKESSAVIQEKAEDTNEKAAQILEKIDGGGISGGGGIAPTNMELFSVAGGNGLAKLFIKGPADTVIDDQLICTVAGVKIVRKDTDYPKTEKAGITVIDIPREDLAKYATEPYVDEGLVNGKTYYYAAFPYSDQDICNRNPANRAEITPKAHTIYGFQYDGDLADPTTKISVPQTAEGYTLDNYGFSNAKMNFGGSFNWGSWKDAFFIPRSCMLDRTTQKPAYYLNENDESKKEDGTASDYKNSSSTLDAMMEWGQNDSIIYMATIPNASGKGGTILFSDDKVDSKFLDYPFRDANGKQVKHFYTAKYFGSSDGTRMRSLSGAANYVNNNAQAEINLARANNPSGKQCYDTLTLAQWMMINNLLVLMAGNTNTQATYGAGRCLSSNTSAIASGTMDGKGMFWGDNTQTNGVKVFGMENWWGNLWRRIRGYINANGTIKLKFTLSNFDGSTATDYNLDGTGYKTISGATPSGTSGGYTNVVKFVDYGFIPVTASGTETTHLCDGYWFNNSQVDYAFVGGSWYNSSLVGAFCVYLDYLASAAGAGDGASLSCTPLAA